MHITIRQLQVFEAVARHLSYTRAAEELHLTQMLEQGRGTAPNPKRAKALYKQAGF